MEQWEFMPWCGMIFGPIMMIVLLAAIVAVVVLIVRWLGGGSLGQLSRHGNDGLQRAIETLKERFAKGEIDKAEFEERRALLEQ